MLVCTVFFSNFAKQFRKLDQPLQSQDFNPLKGRGVNWLHFAIQV